MKRIKPQYFLILLLVAALAAAPFLIRGLIDRSSVGKQPAASVTAAPEGAQYILMERLAALEAEAG